MTTTTEPTPKKMITVQMSETAPVKVDPDQWPIIVREDDCDSAIECQANQVWAIRIREHSDGRRLVYGWGDAGPGGTRQGFRPSHAGYLISVEAEIPGHGSPSDMRRGFAARDRAIGDATVRAIRRVAGAIDAEQLVDACVASLPAQEI